MDETDPWPPLENGVEDQLGLKLVRSKGLVRIRGRSGGAAE